MLARQLDGTVVMAWHDRYESGRLAEERYGCTVHVLDDGFQHLALHRDLDIVLLAQEDVERPRVLPTGRLREPIEALGAADAIVALDGARVEALAAGARIWQARRRLEAARLVEPFGALAEPSAGSVVAVAGIAGPDRFFADLRTLGWPVSRTLAFRDHHPYGAGDIERMLRTARQDGAAMIVTTEKDMVRLLPFRPFPLPVAYLPMTLAVEPAAAFSEWILAAVAQAREAA
jgi:tetraacyldisaccharide 4'-kinase